ncbi:DUF2442 domain-containing protein [Mycolicibacter virginiensis]|uniref:DUF2442 domain-containing protein n=1 Tax=Mycolicibacter virginiensis TaxID=1795032 RepID=UPI0013FD7A07|nr:DUF2442 domain-containing protein [Mycolicibacter virginiensis]
MSIPAYEVTTVEVVDPTTLRVSHADGTVAEHDLARLIARGGVYAPLADAEFFKQVRIAHGAVTWPGEIDLAPDSLWDHSRGRCTGCGWTAAETRVIALPDTDSEALSGSQARIAAGATEPRLRRPRD